MSELGESAAPRTAEPQKIQSIDAEFLSGERFPYQEDMSLVEDVDLLAATPGEDINWLEDITLLDRYLANPVDELPAVPAPAGAEERR